MPQVYLNWKRKSTVGWSIENIILDFGGGLFSFLQIMFKVLKVNSSYEFNIVKFMLSVIAMGFDVIFLFQHYVLYRSAWVTNNRLKKVAELEESIRGMKDENGRFISGEKVNLT